MIRINQHVWVNPGLIESVVIHEGEFQLTTVFPDPVTNDKIYVVELDYLESVCKAFGLNYETIMGLLGEVPSAEG